jgi:hypothetical protein
VIAVFDASGRISMIASTAKGDLANHIGPGNSSRPLRRRTRRLMPGVWVGRNRRVRTRYVYGVSGGRVRFVAVTTDSEGRSASQLRSDLQAAGL